MSGNAYFIYTAILLVLFIGVPLWAFGKKRKNALRKTLRFHSRTSNKDGNDSRAGGRCAHSAIHPFVMSILC